MQSFIYKNEDLDEFTAISQNTKDKLQSFVKYKWDTILSFMNNEAIIAQLMKLETEHQNFVNNTPITIQNAIPREHLFEMLMIELATNQDIDEIALSTKVTKLLNNTAFTFRKYKTPENSNTTQMDSSSSVDAFIQRFTQLFSNDIVPTKFQSHIKKAVGHTVLFSFDFELMKNLINDDILPTYAIIDTRQAFKIKLVSWNTLACTIYEFIILSLENVSNSVSLENEIFGSRYLVDERKGYIAAKTKERAFRRQKDGIVKIRFVGGKVLYLSVFSAGGVLVRRL